MRNMGIVRTALFLSAATKPGQDTRQRVLGYLLTDEKEGSGPLTLRSDGTSSYLVAKNKSGPEQKALFRATH